MDILAHALWAGAGVELARRHIAIPRRTAIAIVALAAVPDLLQLLPMLGWIVFDKGALSALSAYSLASPGTEPAMPPIVVLLTHHLHCITHSAIVALLITTICFAITGRVWMPLWGWWSHIVIDVFTHSADYYPSPVLYPITLRGFDGIAWNEPRFLAVNYVTLLLVGIWLAWSRHRLQNRSLNPVTARDERR